MGSVRSCVLNFRLLSITQFIVVRLDWAATVLEVKIAAPATADLLRCGHVGGSGILSFKWPKTINRWLNFCKSSKRSNVPLNSYLGHYS